MLFAGQRLLAHILRREGASPRPLANYIYSPLGKSRWIDQNVATEDPLAVDACNYGICFTHLWREKHVLKNQPSQRSKFQLDLLTRCRLRAPRVIEQWKEFIVKTD